MAFANPSFFSYTRAALLRRSNVFAIILVVGFVLSIIIVGPVVVVTGPA